MENAEEILQSLEEFSKRRPKVIPRELDEYLHFVARTGDPVYQWALVKNLFKEKLLNVITEFYETSPGLDIPHCPNVDVFNYETMKNSLLEKIDAFSSAPFTVQRICELLTSPRKQYTRIDKFMRAFEKNILVVSTRDPGPLRHTEAENGDSGESMVNGSDSNLDYNVDVSMEDMSGWKENADPLTTYPIQASSSDSPRSSDSGSSQFINQNGPVQGKSTPPHVELMTIEPDTNVTSAAEDLPEPSTSESVSPPEVDSKNEDISDTTMSEEPASSMDAVMSPADSAEPVASEPKLPESEEKPRVESSTDSENLITTTEEKAKIESVPEDIPVRVGVLTEEEEAPKSADLSVPEEMETKEDDAVVEAEPEKSKTPIQDIDVTPTDSPDTNSQENVEMEAVESETPAVESSADVESVSNDTEMDTNPSEITPALDPPATLAEDPPIVSPTDVPSDEMKVDDCPVSTAVEELPVSPVEPATSPSAVEEEKFIQVDEPVEESPTPVVETITEPEKVVETSPESMAEPVIEITEVSDKKESEVVPEITEKSEKDIVDTEVAGDVKKDDKPPSPPVTETSDSMDSV